MRDPIQARSASEWGRGIQARRASEWTQPASAGFPAGQHQATSGDTIPISFLLSLDFGRKLVLCPLPERACVVKGGLCGFFRLGGLVLGVCLQTICAARSSGLVRHRLELNCSVSLVTAINVLRLVTVLRLRSRGLFGRSFLCCDRASTRPFVDARGP
jgi:hypothetical protein